MFFRIERYSYNTMSKKGFQRNSSPIGGYLYQRYWYCLGKTEDYNLLIIMRFPIVMEWRIILHNYKITAN
jgi:hypothetical protein